MGESIRERFRLVRDPRVERRTRRDGKTTVERRYSISSRSGECAQVIGVLARDRWSVENNLHRMLDVAFGEDDCRVRVGNAAEDLSRVGRIALMPLERERSCRLGVKSKRKKAGWDRAHLLTVLGIVWMR